MQTQLKSVQAQLRSGVANRCDKARDRRGILAATRRGWYSTGWRRAEPSGFRSRLAEESGDEVFKEETRPAAESLILAGRRVLLAACKLQVQPENPSHREELAASAKRVLTETAKVTAEGDSAGVSRGGGQAGTQRWVRVQL